MDGISNQSRPRRGFTLVEMLAVVVIIAILASLITAAAIPARRRAQIAGMAMELAQLDMAVRAYKERFGAFPPDFTDMAAVRRHVRKAFPLCTLTDAELNTKFTGAAPCHALTFWLGGMLDANGIPTGFSADPKNPFVLGGSRIGPFFEFDPERLGRPLGTLFIRYWPAGATGDFTGGAMAYFRAENGSYAGKHWASWVYPYKDSGPGTWVNPRSFQIVSSGMDVLYAEDNNNGNQYYLFPTYPTTGTDVEAHHDDMSNFTSGTMEDAMP